MFRVGIITASDSGFAGKREDVSGAVIKEIAAANGYQVTSYTMLPDDRKILAEEMKRLCDDDVADLVLTTGGTGFSPRDCTPEATLDIAERQAQGIAEAMRYSSMLSENTARLFGMYPQKGALQVGSDADIVVWDPSYHGEITAAKMLQNVDYTPYEGTAVTGRAKMVFLRGKQIVADGTVIVEECGAYVHRGVSEYFENHK